MALVKIGKAADMLGVDVQTLRAWEASGELIPDRRSKGGVRYYDIGKIMGLGNEDMPTIGYARVSSHDQKNDLVRQQELLEAFCAAKGWRNEIIADLGSGMNYRKKGLNRLLEMILRKLGAGLTPEAIVADHPRLTPEDIRAAQTFAADAKNTAEPNKISSGRR